jgi:hypothetical protein
VTIRPKMIQKPGSDLRLEVDLFIRSLLTGKRQDPPRFGAGFLGAGGRL